MKKIIIGLIMSLTFSSFANDDVQKDFYRSGNLEVESLSKDKFLDLVIKTDESCEGEVKIRLVNIAGMKMNFSSVLFQRLDFVGSNYHELLPSQKISRSLLQTQTIAFSMLPQKGRINSVIEVYACGSNVRVPTNHNYITVGY